MLFALLFLAWNIQSASRMNHSNGYPGTVAGVMNESSYTSMPALPFDLYFLIIVHMERKDMHSFIRCCKFNLRLCTKFVHNLLSNKFKYLLSNIENKMDIHELMSIPFVEKITMNPKHMNMPSYFDINALRSMSRATSSKYIGIDQATGNAFVSFFLRKAQMKPDLWRVITVVFNETDIECIWLSDTSHLPTFIRPLRAHSFYYRHGSDIRAMNALYFTESISSIFGDKDTWFLNDKWTKYMFWIKGAEEYKLRHSVRKQSADMFPKWLCRIS